MIEKKTLTSNCSSGFRIDEIFIMLGKQQRTEDEPKPSVPAPAWETRKKLLAVGFERTQPLTV